MTDILEKVKQTYDLLSKDEACTGQARAVAKLLERLESGNINVSIIGQFKRGKSSLANRILGETVFPVGIVPITSAVTKVIYGEEKKCEVRFKNGIRKEIAFEEMPKYVSEQQNSNNELGVEEVILHAPSDFLRDGLTFVDTPGVGSYHQNNTQTAYDYLRESDGVIFLLSVDSPINQIEIEFLKNTKEYVDKFYFAVNKTDTVKEEDLKAYIGYCKMLICQMIGVDSIKMFPVSAMTGEGVDKLKEVVLKDSKQISKEILEGSCKKKLSDIIEQTVKQLKFYWKAMNMRMDDLDVQFKSIAEFIVEQKQYAEAKDFGFEVHLNIIRLKLSEKVMELFGMEYSYDIEELPAGIAQMDKQTFMEKVNYLCYNLYDTLNSILLYREENTYTVAHRINAINRLTWWLRNIQESLDEQ